MASRKVSNVSVLMTKKDVQKDSFANIGKHKGIHYFAGIRLKDENGNMIQEEVSCSLKEKPFYLSVSWWVDYHLAPNEYLVGFHG